MAVFAPTPFTTPFVVPRAASQYTSIPYISPSEYRFAPTAVGTSGLVPGATNPQVASLESLAQVLARATAWANEIMFHDNTGSMAANVVTEADYFTVKPDGSVALICNYRPLLEVVGIAVGPSPGEQANLDSTATTMLSVSNKVITLPSVASNSGPVPNFGQWPSVNGKVFVTWQYVVGYPHTSLAANATAGATSIAVQASGLAGTGFVGVDPFTVPTQLRIVDGGATETVVVTAISGLVCTLNAPLQFSHTVPAGPDFIPVTALPWGIEEATISLTNVLIKLKGSRAQVMAASPGQTPSGTEIAQVGASADLSTAMRLLKPFTNVFVRA